MMRILLVALSLAIASPAVAATWGEKLSGSGDQLSDALAQIRAISEARWEISCIKVYPADRDKQLACLADAVRIDQLEHIVAGK